MTVRIIEDDGIIHLVPDVTGIYVEDNWVSLVRRFEGRLALATYRRVVKILVGRAS